MANDVASKLLRGVEGVLATPWTALQYYNKTGTFDGFGAVNDERIKAFVNGEYGDIAENAADLAGGGVKIAKDVTSGLKKTLPLLIACGVVAYFFFKGK